jgi:predicted neutral ceramidase superfamily lipid hydrolase
MNSFVEYLRKMIVKINLGLMAGSFTAILTISQIEVLDYYQTNALFAFSFILPASVLFGFVFSTLDWSKLENIFVYSISLYVLTSIFMFFYGFYFLLLHFSPFIGKAFLNMSFMSAVITVIYLLIFFFKERVKNKNLPAGESIKNEISSEKEKSQTTPTDAIMERGKK